MTIWGPDENRTVEAIAALLEIFPRLNGEDDETLAQRLAQWGVLQGPSVRWEAVIYATRVMVAAHKPGVLFTSLAEIGLRSLHEFNDARWGGMD
jgi:hypothetical protein